MIHPDVLKQIERHSYLGNPSASYGTLAKRCIYDTKKSICTWAQAPDYKVYFTSGGSESINTIINNSINSSSISNPHIITSVAEHTTTLECCKNLEELHRATVTYVSSDPYISEKEVIDAITPNTVLITLIHGNNETGVVNNVESICRHVKKINPNILFHIDAVQTFGKGYVQLKNAGIDAMSFSAHKFNAGSGIGGLVVSPQITIQYPLICGTQQDGCRGGTENVPAIAGLNEGIKIVSHNRSYKNQEMRNYVQYIWNYLEQNIPMHYKIKLITPIKNNKKTVLPNTLMFYLQNGNPNKVCNVDLKRKLQLMGYIVSIGSACKTGSAYASHVVYSLSIPDEARKGILRISVGDFTTKYECWSLARAIISLLK